MSRRKARDATLNLPNLIFQSVQINLNAGKLPAPHGNGVSMRAPYVNTDSRCLGLGAAP